MTNCTQHPDNRRRARSAARALDAYRKANCDDVDDMSVADLITDLGHYADQHGEDFLDIVSCAVANWAAEQNGPRTSVPSVHIQIGGGRP